MEQIAQLQSFIDAQTEYHRQALDILQDLGETLETRWVQQIYWHLYNIKLTHCVKFVAVTSISQLSKVTM